MISKPFFSWLKPKLKYPVIPEYDKDILKDIPLPDVITLHVARTSSEIGDLIVNLGDKVKTGQKVRMSGGTEEYFISMATGTISDISGFLGYLGKNFTSISIKTEGKDTWDEEFKGIRDTISSQDAITFLGALPGNPDFASLLDPETSYDTIVIQGMDRDLLVATNQYIVKSEPEKLKKGIAHLKSITNIDRIIIIVPPELVAEAERTGADVRVIGPVYPDSLSEIVMKNVFNRIVPAGKSCDDLGVAFINAEAVAALASAFEEGKIPVHKILTVINKDGRTGLVKARIGTPLKDLFEALSIETKHGDRVVLGGPMRGTSIYTEEMPVSSDTDAVMVQDREQIVTPSDTPCVNCGECVRACPSKIPVNMLVRVLENGLYEEAADQYDLFSCVECGLCSYVCVAKIPVFHYIMLGKHELERIKTMEESHA